MTESEVWTRKKRIDEKLKSSLLNWTVIHNDEVDDYTSLSSHAVEEYPTETGRWKYALDYFDAVKIGLTATPAAGPQWCCRIMCCLPMLPEMSSSTSWKTAMCIRCFRLPNGTFTPYSQGVKANVIFFQKGLKTENTWIYDCRTNIPGVTKKDRPLIPAMFSDFETCYGDDPNGRAARKDQGEEGRFRQFSFSQIKERKFNLDISWLKNGNQEDPNSLPEPQLLVAEAITELSACVDELQLILDVIEAEELE